MAPPVPPIQDVVRLIGHDVQTTATNYRIHLEKGGGPWGYGPAKKLARAVFSMEMSREVSVHACGQRGNPLGRESNREVGGLIWDLAKERGKFICHPLKPEFLKLRHDFEIRVDPLFFFMEKKRPVIFYLQPRRTHVPGRYGLQVIATAIQSLFSVDDKDGAELLLFDLSCPAGSDTRAAASYSFSDLAPLPSGEIEEYLQRFVDAYDLVHAEGIQRKKRPPRPRPEPDPDLFDPKQP